MKKRIVFFTPSLNRTGSEIALYNLLQKATADFEIIVCVKDKGSLVESITDFPVHVINNKQPAAQGIRRMISKAASVINEKRMLNFLLRKYGKCTWYINTITLPQMVAFASENKIPFILHVHELEQMYYQLNTDQFQQMISGPKGIIACSEACKLRINQAGRTTDVSISNPAIDFDRIKFNDAASVRKKYGIPPDKFVWLMAGTMDPNKNASGFIDIASALLSERKDAHFIWLTGGDGFGYEAFCRSKAKYAGLDNHITWINAGDDYYSCFNMCNAFMLTSIKESFSMVTAEALFLGKPVVTFASGGVSEIVDSDNGIVLDSYRTEDFKLAMLKVMDRSFNKDAAKSSMMKFSVQEQYANWKQIVNSFT